MRYRVEYGYGLFTFAENGIELDLLIRQGIAKGMSADGFKISVEVKGDK